MILTLGRSTVRCNKSHSMRDLTRWRWVITPKCYACSCYGISSVESQRFWVYVISRYTREVGSLTSTSLVHGLDSCEQTWEFVVFNMDFRMRGRVPRALYFHKGSNVFIVTSDARRLAQTSNYRWFVSSRQILSSLLNCGRIFHFTHELLFLAFIRLWILY
jgi:hypothetical protein